MSTESAGNLLAARFAEIKQRQQSTTNNLTAVSLDPKEYPIIIKPASKSWEELEVVLHNVINLEGIWKTARELYDQGYGAELETAAELALEVANMPQHFFAKSISKKSGNWATKTLEQVRKTWEVRRNALEVVERLQLGQKSVKAILALSWRLKGSIMRFLGIATEKGTGIKNPIGLFFALTKKPAPSTA